MVDPTLGEMEKLEALLKELKCVKLDAAVVSHYHADHCDGIPYLQRKHGVQAWLHPRIAEKTSGTGNGPVIYRSKTPVHPDHILPERGKWRWQEYEFSVAPWPGQTWWHAVYQAKIDGKKVLFGGGHIPAGLTLEWHRGILCAQQKPVSRRFYRKCAPDAEVAAAYSGQRSRLCLLFHPFAVQANH